MDRYIDVDTLYKHICCSTDGKTIPNFDCDNFPISINVSDIKKAIIRQPIADVAEVVRCKDCIYYHKSHVLCGDGTEKDYSEFPPEAFLGTLVSGYYGINVGGQCEIEKNCGYECDKSVFRNENDYCSRGARMDGENND